MLITGCERGGCCEAASISLYPIVLKMVFTKYLLFVLLLIENHGAAKGAFMPLVFLNVAPACLVMA